MQRCASRSRSRSRQAPREAVIEDQKITRNILRKTEERISRSLYATLERTLSL